MAGRACVRREAEHAEIPRASARMPRRSKEARDPTQRDTLGELATRDRADAKNAQTPPQGDARSQQGSLLP